MKLRNKALLIIFSLSALFLILALLSATRLSPITLVAFILLFAGLTFLTLYFLVIKPIEKLNQLVAKIDADNIVAQRLNVKGNDEVAEIASHVNGVLEGIQTTEEEFELLVEERIQELHKANFKLQQDIAEQKMSQRQLERSKDGLSQLAHYDSLTSLPNRIFFNEILNKTISHTKRHNKILAILVINLDGFKKLIGGLGNSKSDEVLKEISKRLITTLRSEDILAKLEGDEFIVLLNDMGKPKFAGAVAEKILQVCAQSIKLNSSEISLTVSIGICIYPNDGQSLETLLNNAYMALYQAKIMGGNNYQFYTEEIDIEAREYIKLDDALRKAIQNNELSLHYQPKLHIKRGNIIGVEALLRWTHPKLGIISPTKFIPLAEESGLILQLGEWTLREACRANKSWQDQGYEHITVGVNLSPKQFYHPDIAQLITNVLKETGLNPNYLELEITETTIMDNITKATEILDRLKATGVQISLDHFGTGYTSISHLKKFPISVLKIDHSFIKGIPQNPNDMAITNAFIGLAHNLGFQVIAEGVETAEQVQYLSTQDCDMVQGYYLSHPLPEHTVTLQLKKLMDEVLL